MKKDGTVNRGALPAIFNPEDKNALEMALSLKEKYNATIIAATMGPPKAAELLRETLYMGADETFLITDRAFAGADTLATSYALACCAKKIADYDIIMCGRQAIDGDTAQVGPQLAEKLNIPQLSYVLEILKINKKKKTIKVKRAIDGGFEVVEAPLPILLTVPEAANEPRPASAKKIMSFKKAMTGFELQKKHGDAIYEDSELLATEEAKLRKKNLWIQELTAADINADVERVGLKGSPTKVKQIENVVLGGGSLKNIEPSIEGISGLVHELIEDHILG